MINFKRISIKAIRKKKEFLTKKIKLVGISRMIDKNIFPSFDMPNCKQQSKTQKYKITQSHN